MENTTPGSLKNSLTSTPCMKRKSLFNPPDCSPISRGSNRKRNSATNIVSKIPVKLSKRTLQIKIPRWSGLTKTSDQEKPVLRTIINNDQTDESAKTKGKKGNRPKVASPVAAPNKEESMSKSSSSNKKNGGGNTSKTVLEDLDDDGDFESNKKGKKNVSKIKKCSSPKKSKPADAKGEDKNSVKSARGKKKAAVEETEEVVDNIPEETKINEKIQLDGEGANKVAETRRVVKKVSNKDQKNPTTRNKRKAADCGLEPVAEEQIDVEEEKKLPVRNKRKTADVDLEPVAEEPIDVEDEGRPLARIKRKTTDLDHPKPDAEEPMDAEDGKKPSARIKRKTADLDRKPVDEERPPTRIERNTADLDPKPVAEEPVDVEDGKKPSARIKRKTADLDRKPVDEERPPTRTERNTADLDPKPVAEEPVDVEDEKRPSARITRKAADVDRKPVDEERPPTRIERNTADLDPKPVDEDPMDVEAAPTRQFAKTRRMRSNQAGKNCDSEPKESALKEKEKCNHEVEDLDDGNSGDFESNKKGKKNVSKIKKCPSPKKSKPADSKEAAPKNMKKRVREENVKVVSAAFSEEEKEIVKDSTAESATEPLVIVSKPAPKNMKKRVREWNFNVVSAAFSEEEKEIVKDSTAESATEPLVIVSKPAPKNMKKRVREENVKVVSAAFSEEEKEIVKDSTAESATGMCPVKTSNSFNATSGFREYPLNRIFGNTPILDSTAPVKVFKSIKPSDNVMGGFLSISASSSHSAVSTNYNLFFLATDTKLKVTIVGYEKTIGKHTSFLIPKDCQYTIENLGKEAAILSFTKLRSI